MEEVTTTTRFATLKDFEFVHGGKYEIMKIEGYLDLLEDCAEEERDLTIRGIEKDNVLIAERNGGIFFDFQFAEPIGFIWFAFASDTPYGVNYGSWWNP